MDQKEIIKQFYTAFSNGNIDEMLACYHDDVVFEDPAFGKLSGNRAKTMWRMLLGKREQSKLTVSFELDKQSDHEASWVASYLYGPKKRKVVNHVRASFVFKEGKIVQHTDVFDLWKWTQQALGPAGYLLGWSSFMKEKIQQTTQKALDQYLLKQTQ